MFHGNKQVIILNFFKKCLFNNQKKLKFEKKLKIMTSLFHRNRKCYFLLFKNHLLCPNLTTRCQKIVKTIYWQKGQDFDKIFLDSKHVLVVYLTPNSKKSGFFIFTTSVQACLYQKWPLNRVNLWSIIWYFVTEIGLTYCEKKLFYWSRKTRGWRLIIYKIFEITRTIYSNSKRSAQFLLTECFFNLFLQVSQIQ